MKNPAIGIGILLMGALISREIIESAPSPHIGIILVDAKTPPPDDESPLPGESRR